MDYSNIVTPTTEDNRFKEGTVNAPVTYHNYLLDCCLDWRRQDMTIKSQREEIRVLKEKLEVPLTWKERLTGYR